MPGKGKAYPVDDTWRRRVAERLDELGIRPAELARRARVSRSIIGALIQLDATKEQRHQSPHLPEIHKALGWPPPKPALAPGEVAEIAYLFDRLDSRGRELVLSAARKELDRLIGQAANEQRTVKKS